MSLPTFKEFLKMRENSSKYSIDTILVDDIKYGAKGVPTKFKKQKSDYDEEILVITDKVTKKKYYGWVGEENHLSVGHNLMHYHYEGDTPYLEKVEMLSDTKYRMHFHIDDDYELSVIGCYIDTKFKLELDEILYIDSDIHIIEKDEDEDEDEALPTSKKVTKEQLQRLLQTKNKNGECEGLDVSGITNMSALFENTDYGKWLISDIDTWDTSKVTDMEAMFQGCTSLQEAPKFNTSNVTEMNAMFQGCTSLKEAPKFNTSNVTNMGSMFLECSSLKEAPKFNTTKVINMNMMFKSCTSLTKGDMSNWDVSKVIYSGYMFYNCPFPEDKKPKFNISEKIYSHLI